MSSYIDEPYQDNYQSQEQMAWEVEVEYQEQAIREANDFLPGFLDYLNSMAFVDNEMGIECLNRMIEKSINFERHNQHAPFTQLVNDAIVWKAEQYAKEILR